MISGKRGSNNFVMKLINNERLLREIEARPPRSTSFFPNFLKIVPNSVRPDGTSSDVLLLTWLI